MYEMVNAINTLSPAGILALCMAIIFAFVALRFIVRVLFSSRRQPDISRDQRGCDSQSGGGRSGGRRGGGWHGGR